MSTIDLYHKRRYAALQTICGHRIPMCEQCGKLLHVDTSELHVHHVNEDEGHGRSEGGWQHLYRIEKDIAEGVEMEVLCTSCHKHHHENLEGLKIEPVQEMVV